MQDYVFLLMVTFYGFIWGTICFIFHIIYILWCFEEQYKIDPCEVRDLLQIELTKIKSELMEHQGTYLDKDYEYILENSDKHTDEFNKLLYDLLFINDELEKIKKQLDV